MNDKDFERLINAIIIFDKKLTQKEIEEMLLNEELMTFIIERTNKKDFNTIMKLLGNPEIYITQREDLENKIIKNIATYDFQTKKDMISQVYLGDHARNVVLTVETILQRFDSNEEFKQNFDEELIMFIREIHTFLKSNNENIDIEELLNKLNTYQEELKENKSNIGDFINKIHYLAKKDFENELKRKLNAGEILEGIEPQIVKNSSGKTAQLYTLEKQTPNQEHFMLLARTVYSRNILDNENITNAYLDNIDGRPYLSYSLINEEDYSLFSERHNIIFGFFGTEDNQLMSANIYDGQTNQRQLKENQHVVKQQYLKLEEFLEKTERYNEIVLKNEKPLKPSFIIIKNPNPTEEIITLASSMNIPIIYMNPEYYKRHEATTIISEQEKDKNWYDHYKPILDYNLSNIALKNTSTKQ